MKIRVLGSAAGGGLPQWNCGGTYSARARNADPSVPPRTQPSIALSAGDGRWSLVNASPDIRQQLADFPGLHPLPGTRDIPLDTVAITNVDLDHTIGLLILRESLPYRVVSTPWARDAVLPHNAAFRLIAPAWSTAGLVEGFALDRAGHLEAKFFPLPGKVPTYLKDVAKNHAEATVGLRVTDTRSGRRLVYAPGIQQLDEATLAELRHADLRFVDGTFWTATELLSMRPGAPDAFTMGHVPITGEGGSLELLEGMPGRTVYIHINNTNPILDADSPEAARVRQAGITIAMDGMELEL
ncbi:MAG: pyrroloquinoline quinone biosynthesis protein PqqB [Myxococcota bacterium]|nr:pyrroloquinoline quinone biosynthesis protein PqqB [Myxococcota bacterium]